ncbi:hypothetical protein [Mycobacterium sp.]|uniref:hypothetical protein n=1 Tax=Mycobacterium sp. TaxID=1785 RepID=UPI0025FB92E4|nr:hypothetical protein [Mycobacterium sp.]
MASGLGLAGMGVGTVAQAQPGPFPQWCPGDFWDQGWGNNWDSGRCHDNWRGPGDRGFGDRGGFYDRGGPGNHGWDRGGPGDRGGFGGPGDHGGHGGPGGGRH